MVAARSSAGLRTVFYSTVATYYRAVSSSQSARLAGTKIAFTFSHQCVPQLSRAVSYVISLLYHCTIAASAVEVVSCPDHARARLQAARGYSGSYWKFAGSIDHGTSS